MDLKEIVERNKAAHHRLGVITKELYDTLADGHHNSLRASQVLEMMNASFAMLKESDVMIAYVDQELFGCKVEIAGDDEQPACEEKKCCDKGE